MSDEQRSAIKFCVLSRFLKKKTTEMLTHAYEKDAAKKTTVYKWYKRFVEGHENIGYDEPAAQCRKRRLLKSPPSKNY